MQTQLPLIFSSRLRPGEPTPAPSATMQSLESMTKLRTLRGLAPNPQETHTHRRLLKAFVTLSATKEQDLSFQPSLLFC